MSPFTVTGEGGIINYVEVTELLLKCIFYKAHQTLQYYMRWSLFCGDCKLFLYCIIHLESLFSSTVELKYFHHRFDEDIKVLQFKHQVKHF